MSPYMNTMIASLSNELAAHIEAIPDAQKRSEIVAGFEAAASEDRLDGDIRYWTNQSKAAFRYLTHIRKFSTTTESMIKEAIRKLADIDHRLVGLKELKASLA